jgi:hypothetical protein
MRTYVAVTGIAFALIVAAHLARIADEGLHPLTEPIFVVSSAIAGGLALWAWWLLRRAPADGDGIKRPG